MECDKVLASVFSLKAAGMKASGRTIKCTASENYTILTVHWLTKDSGLTMNFTEWERFSVLTLLN